jgi:hypothetical protein
MRSTFTYYKIKIAVRCEDEIINEYIKSTVKQFINVYEKLFNVIFDNGIMPSSWLIGMIKPIYKNKGDKFDPKLIWLLICSKVPSSISS